MATDDLWLFRNFLVEEHVNRVIKLLEASNLHTLLLTPVSVHSWFFLKKTFILYLS